MSSDGKYEFYQLGPEEVLKAVESAGFICSAELLALNSYENRVYMVGLESGGQLIAKFYRPERWSDAAILEEHMFTQELAELDITAVPPMRVDGETLFHHCGHRFSLYPLKAGRAPDLESQEQLEQLGRYIGRIHALGAVRSFEHRPTLDVGSFGDDSYEFLIEHGFIPLELEAAYEKVSEDLLDGVEDYFNAIKPSVIRLHGDGHQGNILWDIHSGSGTPYIIDFDDARMGPAIQDLWMFLSGDRANMSASLDTLLTAYNQFYDFNSRELVLIEPLRALRIMHHAAWLARRCDDPAFKHAFPWFNTQQYWEKHILALKEQIAAIQEPPLQWS